MSEERLPRVLITNRVPDEHLRPLSGVAEVVHGSDPSQLMPREEVLRRAHEFHGIINQTELRVDGELLDLAGRLQIVANIGIGTDNLDLELMASRGVWATNTPEAPVDATADCTLGMLLSVSRRLAEADRYVRTGNWPRDGFEGGRWDGWILRTKFSDSSATGASVVPSPNERGRSEWASSFTTRSTPRTLSTGRSSLFWLKRMSSRCTCR